MPTKTHLALVLYAKTPLPGLVKTRLRISGHLSKSWIVEFQIAMIKDILDCISLVEVEFVPILSYHPRKTLHIMEEIANNVPSIKKKKLKFQAQNGNNQALRFSSAFASALSLPNISSLVIIGADTPQIQPNFIKNILLNLQTEKKLAFLGPSQSGGFYLLGISKPVLNLEQVFQKGIDEFQNLVRLLTEQDFDIHFLPEMTDIDTIDDLRVVAIILKNLKTENVVKGKTNYIPNLTFNIIKKLDSVQ